jgi:hypothetical protein
LDAESKGSKSKNKLWLKFKAMLSKKVKDYLIEEGFFDETEDKQYQKVISDLDIPLDTAFADFNLHTNSVTFSGQLSDLYNICWFTINSGYLTQVDNIQKALKLPSEYIPLDSFEGEGGFFYNRKTGEVLEIELGEKLKEFLSGKLQPQWKNFNDFLEWYFELS